MSRCTVLGGQGYIGQNLAAYLRTQGWDCAAPVRGDASIFSHDLGLVFYCVGLTADFRSRPLDTVEAHVGLLQRVLREARFDKLIYLSSTRVYLGAHDTHEDQPLQAQPGNPDDLYKLSKLMGESLTLHNGRPALVVRLSNVVGGQGQNTESFVYSLLREASQGHVLLRSDPASAKDYIHIDNVVQLLHCIAQGAAHRIYNVASGVQISHRQWLERISQTTGCQWSVGAQAETHQFLPIHIERIASEFNFSPLSVLSAFEKI